MFGAVECRHCGDGNFCRILCHDEGIPGCQAGDIGEAFCLKVLFAVFGGDDVANLGEEGAAAGVKVVGVGVVREQDCIDGENRFGGDGCAGSLLENGNAHVVVLRCVKGGVGQEAQTRVFNQDGGAGDDVNCRHKSIPLMDKMYFCRD